MHMTIEDTVKNIKQVQDCINSGEKPGADHTGT